MNEMTAEEWLLSVAMSICVGLAVYLIGSHGAKDEENIILGVRKNTYVIEAKITITTQIPIDDIDDSGDAIISIIANGLQDIKDDLGEFSKYGQVPIDTKGEVEFRKQLPLEKKE